MNTENAREMTRSHLQNEMNKIVFYYMKVYDEYYSTGSRDSAFIKDLVDAIQGISAILEVYVEQKGIHPNYALEKLNWSRSYIESARKYFESKGEQNAGC